MPQKDAYQLTVNGKEHSSHAATLGELLVELGLEGAPLVAEVNMKIITAEDMAATPVAAGDVVELIRFVGGG